MRITFLGTGGGRWVVLRQLRASGGFVLELAGEKMHVDPGPGTLIKAKEYRVDLCDVTGVFVSHRHQDHMNDALVLIESMTRGATKKRGLFASTRSVIKGDKDHPSILDSFHSGVLKRLEVLKPGRSIKLGKVKVTATPTRHREGDEIGFVFEGDGLKIGYTGDGEYFTGMEKHFMKCDYLIMNVLRPRNDSWPGHMNSEGAAMLIKGASPKTAIMQHFGMKMLRGIAFKEADWIRKQTSTRVIVARDGLVLKEGRTRKNTKSLEKFL